MKDKTKTLWAVMTFPIQYSSRELLPNADIDLALFQTAQGWSDTQASVTVGRQRGLTEARDPGEREHFIQTQYQRQFPEMFKRGPEGRLFLNNTLISCDVCHTLLRHTSCVTV